MVQIKYKGFSSWGLFLYTVRYCFMLSAALDSSGVLQSYSIVSLHST